MNNIYILSDKKCEGVNNLPVFEIDFLDPGIKIADYDALIFTSKNGAYSLDSLNKEWKNIPSYAISPITAKVIESLGGNLEFTGTKSNGNDFARELIDILQDKKVLYIRAQKVVSDIIRILNDSGVECDEYIAYKTVCKTYDKNQSPPKGSTIICSSPSSVECFLKNFDWDQSYKAIAIGSVTAKTLESYNISCQIAPNTSLESCIALAKS